MPEPTDPANARLALRRLIASTAGVRAVRPISDPGEPLRPEPTVDDVLAELDTDELADYEVVLDALRVCQPQRFAVFGCDVVDLAETLDPHSGGIVRRVATGQTGPIATAIVAMLNEHPDEWTERLLHAEEPF